MPKDLSKKNASEDLNFGDDESAAAYEAAKDRRKESNPEPETRADAPEARRGEEPSFEAPTRQTAAKRQDEQLAKVGNIIAWVAAPLVLILFLYAQLKHAEADPNKVGDTPTLPIQGQFVDVSSADSGWKVKAADDKVTGVPEVLTRRLVYPNRLPAVTLKVTPKAGSAYLRVLFLDGQGQIAGDPRLVKVENGKVSATSTSEKVLEDGSVRVTGSAGFIDRNYLDDYMSGQETRWSVEISESADYKARGEDWKKLQTFHVANLELR
jgi:hypothetical protein